MAGKIQLPHEGEEIDRLIRHMKEAVVETRTTTICDTRIEYAVCDPWPEGLDEAMYDQDGRIYLPESSVRSDARRADLGAYHEHVEICHKLAGRSHGYAHHRALLMEFLAAKQAYDKNGLKQYVHDRVFMYPDWKMPDKSNVAQGLCELLSAKRPLRRELVKVFREARM